MVSEPIVLRSPILERAGFAHGFSLRTGGVSEGPYASLNLGRSVGDDPARVAENLRRFCGAIGVEPAELYEVSQVHGREVAVVEAGDAVGAVRLRSADAIVIRRGAAGVRTADCVPILIGDRRTGAAAAVHAGWRGVVARVIDSALVALGGQPRDLVAAIGPHIRAEAFEVGEDVASRIAEVACGANVIVASTPRPHVDLALAVRAQLERFGLSPSDIDDVGGCTLREADRFFSHRRDAGTTGRHLSVIAAKGQSC